MTQLVRSRAKDTVQTAHCAVEHVAAPVEPVLAPVDKGSSASEAPGALFGSQPASRVCALYCTLVRGYFGCGIKGISVNISFGLNGRAVVVAGVSVEVLVKYVLQQNFATLLSALLRRQNGTTCTLSR